MKLQWNSCCECPSKEESGAPARVLWWQSCNIGSTSYLKLMESVHCPARVEHLWTCLESNDDNPLTSFPVLFYKMHYGDSFHVTSYLYVRHTFISIWLQHSFCTAPVYSKCSTPSSYCIWYCLSQLTWWKVQCGIQ